MAKQKAGVYDKVLECAKEEFLSKGFLDASLRTIAQAAETSTGSIYTRFGDKEGLFRAIAEPVVDQFKAMFRRVQEDFHQLSEEEQRADMGQYTARHQEETLAILSISSSPCPMVFPSASPAEMVADTKRL